MRFNNIDITKLVMSFFVVAIHVWKLSNHTMLPIMDFIVRLAVPFFLIVSGFFLWPKFFNETNETKSRILTKYIYMYFVWTIIYIPFAILYYIKAGYTISDALREYINDFIFTGETPMAWHMWYMHTLIISILILWLLSYIKLGIDIIFTLVFTVALFFDVIIAFDIPILMGVKRLVENGQNFLLTGLPTICLGALIKKCFIKFQLSKQLMLSISIIAILCCLLLYKLHIHYYCIILSALIFIVMMKINQVNNTNITLLMGECSKYVYFLHLIVAFALRGKIDSVYLYWIIVVVISMILSISLYYIKRQLFVGTNTSR